MSEITPAPLGTPQTSPRRGHRLGMFLAFLPILALLAIFGWNMFDDARGQVKSGLAPDFTLSLFDGGELTLSELRGQIIVVNFPRFKPRRPNPTAPASQRLRPMLPPPQTTPRPQPQPPPLWTLSYPTPATFKAILMRR